MFILFQDYFQIQITHVTCSIYHMDHMIWTISYGIGRKTYTVRYKLFYIECNLMRRKIF